MSNVSATAVQDLNQYTEIRTSRFGYREGCFFFCRARNPKEKHWACQSVNGPSFAGHSVSRRPRPSSRRM